MRRRWCGLSGDPAPDAPGARQICRATGPTIAAAPRAAEDGGYQNGQRRETKGRCEPRHRTDGLRARRGRELEPLKQRKEIEK